MKKTLLFCLVSFAANGQNLEESVPTILLKKFIPTAFGSKSRTLDIKDAENVAQEIQGFKVSNPAVVIDRIEILTCTSDFEPHQTALPKKIDEHVQLAKERNDMIRTELVKNFSVPIQADSKVCGPNYKPLDLNDRLVAVESGDIFIKKLKELQEDQVFIAKLKEEALIDNVESLPQLYTTIFQKKFQPFQGIRLFIWGKVKGSVEKTKPKPPSSKNQ